MASFFSKIFGKNKKECPPPNDAPTQTEDVAPQIYSLPDGCTYEGGWKDDKYHGYGIFKWPDGTKYEGQFVDGDKWGEGKNYFSNGDVYVGDFKYDKPHGRGLTVYANGDEYEGGYYAALRDGSGTFKYNSTGEKYEGTSCELFLVDLQVNI